tara:strand:- start:807 stop:2435 length:1629 start_codon:yes stop_codon:yes gene_type:complete
LHKIRILLLLLVIISISLAFKLYLVDFSSPPITEDTYGYVLRAISISNEDFSEHSRKTLGWSILISPFLSLTDSDNFLVYLNTAQYLSIAISLITIFPMYLLARRFFDDKFSLVACSLFAFEPHLNYNSVLGLSEPIFILLTIITAYFILQKNSNLAFLSFLTVGLLWWMRFNGIITVIVISIIFFLIHKISFKSVSKYGLCILVFLVVVSPMLIQKDNQYGDPLYFSQSNYFFSGEYSAILAENTLDKEFTASDYIEENGVGGFLEKFVFTGLYNIFVVIYKFSFPYLIVLLPFGILFSLRAFDQNSNFIKSNWIFIIISLSIFVIYFAVVPEKRLIYHIFPFIIILSTITIQRFYKYGLSTFSFSSKQKNYSLIIIIMIVIILSGVYTSRYDAPDSDMVQEKLEFSKIVLDEFDDVILDAGDTLRLIKFTELNASDDFKEYRTSQDNEFFKNLSDIHQITLHASSLEELISIGKEHDLRLISVNRNGVNEIWYPYLSELYTNHDNYLFLTEVIDTKALGYEKFHVKVFEIDYKKFQLGSP